MGMYDVVLVPCPQCDTEHEAQSKGGDCSGRYFTISCVPADVASDVNRHAPFICSKCNREFSVNLPDQERNVDLSGSVY